MRSPRRASTRVCLGKSEIEKVNGVEEWMKEDRGREEEEKKRKRKRKRVKTYRTQVRQRGGGTELTSNRSPTNHWLCVSGQ